MTILTLNKKELEKAGESRKPYKLLGIANNNMFPGDLSRSPDDFFISFGGFL